MVFDNVVSRRSSSVGLFSRYIFYVLPLVVWSRRNASGSLENRSFVVRRVSSVAVTPPRVTTVISSSSSSLSVLLLSGIIGDCFIRLLVLPCADRRSAQMARSDDPFKEGYLYFPPHGVLSQLKVSPSMLWLTYVITRRWWVWPIGLLLFNYIFRFNYKITQVIPPVQNAITYKFHGHLVVNIFFKLKFCLLEILAETLL